jgi:DNA-binding protein
LNKKGKNAVIKSRKILIYNAVNLALLLYKIGIANIENIEIGTSMLIGLDGKIRPVGFIEITVSKLSER